MLIILPLAGLAIAFPFSSADTNGYVNYRSTETLNFNEYWYEYEYVKAGNTITFSLDSYSSPVTFAIANVPFDQLPRTTKTFTETYTFDLEYDEYIYYQVFLYPGSTIDYTFTATAGVEFLIVDGDNAVNWLYSDPFDYYKYIASSTGHSSVVTADQAKDYYLIWYSTNSGIVDCSFDVTVTAKNRIDFSNLLYSVEDTTAISQNSVTVPTSGNWYFFIFMDPLFASEDSTTITFDVTYSTGVTAVDRWANARPTLITIAVICAILIGVAVIARKMQKTKDKQQETTSTPAQPQVTTPNPASTPVVQPTVSVQRIEQKAPPPPTPSTTKEFCYGCGSQLSEQSQFCPNCGKKRMGRDLEDHSVPVKPQAQFCGFCGNKVTSKQAFCEACGTPVER
jgi:hypothetical protein